MISTSRTSDFQISGSAISSHKNIQQSVNQDEVEILVVDGGSTDRTREIAQRYGAIIYSNPRRLPEYAKAIGTSQATGHYVVRMDSDEEFSYCTQLQDKMEFLKSHPELKVLIPNKCSGGGAKRNLWYCSRVYEYSG